MTNETTGTVPSRALDVIADQAATIARLERELAEAIRRVEGTEAALTHAETQCQSLQTDLDLVKPKAEALAALAAWSRNCEGAVSFDQYAGHPAIVHLSADRVAVKVTGTTLAAAIMDALEKAKQ